MNLDIQLNIYLIYTIMFNKQMENISQHMIQVKEK